MEDYALYLEKTMADIHMVLRNLQGEKMNIRNTSAFDRIKIEYMLLKEEMEKFLMRRSKWGSASSEKT